MWVRFFAPLKTTRPGKMDETTSEMPWGCGPAARGCPAAPGSQPGVQRGVSFSGEGGFDGGSWAGERGFSVGHLRP